MRLGVRESLVDGQIVTGDVAIEDGTVTGVGLQPAGRTGLATSGFVDVHVNGFAGVDFLAADADGYARAGEALARTGVVAYQPTFVSSPPGIVLDALRQVAALAPDAPHVLGVHLEGPFLSPTQAGAHDPAHLRAVDPALAEQLVSAGPVTTVTLAPELDGALDLIGSLTGRGIVVSLGHSDADAPTARAGFDRGARAVTVALARDDVVVQLIADGVHLAPETVVSAFRSAPGRTCLVTDAIEAAGLGDGTYRLGARVVRVEGLEARADDGCLSGSVVTLDVAVRNAVSWGVPLIAALEAASAVPARLLGRGDVGALRIGRPASLVVLDDDLTVRRTLVAGRELAAV